MGKEEVSNRLSWSVHEYENHKRDKKWYVIATIIAIVSIIYAIITENYNFVLVIIIASFVLILREREETDEIMINLTPEGVYVGQKFYDYDEFKDFIVLYKPAQDIKNLYFEFNNPVKQRLSIYLEDIDPGQVRDFLLRYLEENIDRVGIPVSERINKLLKL